MRVLYTLILIFAGCNKSSLKNLTFKEKSRITNLIIYTIKNEAEIDNFVTELKLIDYEKKIKNMLNLKEFSTPKGKDLTGKEILLQAIKEDDNKVIEAYYDYQKPIFNFNIQKNKNLINELLEIICKNRAHKSLESLTNILKCQFQNSSIDISKLLIIISENNLEDIFEYKILKENYISMKDKENTLNTLTIRKSNINSKDIASIGIGLGSIGVGFSKIFEESRVKTALVIGGALLVGVPTYLYWKNCNEYKIESSLREEKLEKIITELNFDNSKLKEIEENIEQIEISMVKCLVRNFRISINEELIEKFEEVKKNEISKYLKMTLSKNNKIKE